MPKMIVQLRQSKATPGAVLYKEIDENGREYPAPNAPGCKVAQVYLRKNDLREGIPNLITVTVEWE